MHFLNRIIKSLLITSMFLFLGTGISNAANYSDYTINSNYSYTLSDSGRYNSYWENYEVRLQYLFPQLASDTAVTHIRFRIKFNGTDARADRNPYMDVQLADQYISYNGLFGSPASPFLMARRFKSDSPSGQWFEYSFNFDPDAGTQVANRTVYLEIGGYDSYDYCSWTFELLELSYRKYSVDFTLSITPERYVKATIGRYSGNTDTRIALQNVNDGRWIIGGPNSYNSFSGSSLEYTVLDTGVKPEVTYTYYLYYKVGSSNLIPAIGPWTLTIKVPSDATIAAEQTMDAGYSAAQWAHWANDHARANRGFLDGSLNGGKSLSSVFDKSNEASSRTWDSATSKSAATLAREARDSAGTAAANALGAFDATQTAITRLDSIQAKITNTENKTGADLSPPVVRIKTVTGSLATSGGSVKAALSISDNIASTFDYSLDGVTFSPVPADKQITLPVNNPGPNIIMVWARDAAGNVGSESIIIRKL